MNTLIRSLAPLALAATTALALPARGDAPAPDAAPAPAVANSLDELFNELDIPYSMSGGTYRVNWVDDGRGSSFFFSVEDMWTLVDGTTIRLVGASVLLFQIPPGVQPSPAMLRRINELNGRLDIGHVVAVTQDGGPGIVVYNTSFWLNDATSRTLLNHIWYAHDVAQTLTDELMPFISA